MLPRSLNRIATKSSTTVLKQRTSVSSLPALSPTCPASSRRTFVHPSRADRAAVVELPTHSSSIPSGTLSPLFPILFPIFNHPFHSRSSLQTRPTTTPTTNLRSKPNLPRCPGPPFLLPTSPNRSLRPPFSAGYHRNGPPCTRRHDALLHRYVWQPSLKNPCLWMGG